jgi:hypothetical protein
MKVELKRHDGHLPGIATYTQGSNIIRFGSKSFHTRTAFPKYAAAKLVLRIEFGRMTRYGTEKYTMDATEIHEEAPVCKTTLQKKTSQKKTQTEQLDQSVLKKTWNFVQRIEGRALAPLTPGSKLEAQLLVSRVEALRIDATRVRSRYAAGKVPGVSDLQWRKFKRAAFA